MNTTKMKKTEQGICGCGEKFIKRQGGSERCLECREKVRRENKRKANQKAKEKRAKARKAKGSG